MAGIQETKEVMVFGVGMAMAIDESTKDGFQWTDIFNLVPPLTELPVALEGINDVPEEIKDMDDNERKELIEAINDLDFASDRSEEVAKQALRAGLENLKLVALIREIRENE
jgi:hypothetical protein